MLERAMKVIPGGSQTYSKSHHQYVDGYPEFVTEGKGAYVKGIDGRWYLDYVMGLGAVTLGYAVKFVNDAVKKQLEQGSIYSLPHVLEVELAELYCDLFNCDMVRFGKNGSDATSGAVRLARAVTGRNVIACTGYHGWQDWYIGSTNMGRGVPCQVRAMTKHFDYGDYETVKELLRAYKVAAVILEPVDTSKDQPDTDFLRFLRRICDETGTLLVFDEMVSGFRVGYGGASTTYVIKPDLACYGKGIANGMPLSVLAGKREYMKELDNGVFYSFTYGGETLSLAAAKATFKYYMENDVISGMYRSGTALKVGINKIARDTGIYCVGPHPYSHINFPHHSIRSAYQSEMLKRGILTLGTNIVCDALSNSDIRYTLNAFEDALPDILKGSDKPVETGLLRG